METILLESLFNIKLHLIAFFNPLKTLNRPIYVEIIETLGL